MFTVANLRKISRKRTTDAMSESERQFHSLPGSDVDEPDTHNTTSSGPAGPMDWQENEEEPNQNMQNNPTGVYAQSGVEHTVVSCSFRCVRVL